MSLEPIGGMMADAKRHGYAVGYFESWSIDFLYGVIDAAEAQRSPVIVGFNGGFLSHAGRLAAERLTLYGALGKAAAEAASVPCSFIFNECPADDWTKAAVAAGFNLVMPADATAGLENYAARVTDITALAHGAAVAVEAEVGELPSEAPGDDHAGSVTEAKQAAAFVEETGIDLLAVSVGNVHIALRSTHGLDLERLAAIRRAVDIPLVLHGGTGISPQPLQEAIRLGVTKINYGTYLKQRYLDALRKAVAVDEPNPHALLGLGGAHDLLVVGRNAVREAVLERLPLLGIGREGLTMATVGCAGILVADTFCGPMQALPEPGQLLAIDDLPMSAGGCAANVAIDLARQGIDADVVGCLGRDVAAEAVVSTLQRTGVGCGHIVRSDRLPTSKTVILLVEGQDRRYIHAFGANAAFAVRDIDPEWAAGLKVFYLGGLFAMPGIDIAELAGLLAACRRAHVATVLDVVVPQHFADRDALDRLLPFVDYFLPNSDEARIFTGAGDPFDQIAALQARGARTVIVTCGAEGSCAGSDGRWWRATACHLETVDPSGSGDAFAAGVITGIVRGWDLPAMLRYGSALGASAARAVGTTGSVFQGAEAEAFIVANPIDVQEVRWK